MDDADRAQPVIDEDLNDHLAEHYRRRTQMGLKGESCIRPPFKDSPKACINCEEPIPAARLAVQPNADRCVSCQHDFEIQTRRPL